MQSYTGALDGTVKAGFVAGYQHFAHNAMLTRPDANASSSIYQSIQSALISQHSYPIAECSVWWLVVAAAATGCLQSVCSASALPA